MILGIVFGLLSIINTYKTSIENNKDLLRYHCNKTIKGLLREQRHDYMNIFQIIYGYLQLEKSDKAIEQIKKVTSITSNISQAYNITIPSIALLLDKKIREANNQGLLFTCNIKTSNNGDIRVTKNEEKIIKELNNIFDILINSLNDNDYNILIDILEDDKKIKFIFTGNFIDKLRGKDKKLPKSCSINKNNIKVTFNYINYNKIDPNINSYIGELVKM
ncbi:Spo0B domain-containing protein [Dethiothermospora halolimnae]|uniref:Spo0B domain-containing protein n=1 Tax=Dethiothermospora halolimnae TaxID=3114390 RepID=UPI003CCB90A3